MKYHLSIPLILLIILTGCMTTERGASRSVGIAPAGEITLPPGVSLTRPLSEEQAVWIALLNNGAFREAMADVGLAEADILLAQTLPNPTLAMLFPAGPKQLEFAVKYPVEAIWLRPMRVEIAKLDVEKVADSLSQSGLDLVRDVRIAYTDVSQANQRVMLAREAVELSDQVSELVAAQLNAGTALQLEVTTATSDGLQAKEELTQLEDEVELATHRLAKLLGVGMTEIRIGTSGLAEKAVIPADSGKLIGDAFAARPDLRAAEIAIEAAMMRAGLAQSEAYKLTAVYDTNGSGSSFEHGPGIELPIPIFDRNQAGRSRAQANVEKASRHYLAVRDQIILEVREAHTRARQAQRSADTWGREIIPPLESALNLAEKSYKGGSAAFLQVVDTKRKLTAARLRESEARAGFHRAIIELERAVGHPHHQ